MTNVTRLLVNRANFHQTEFEHTELEALQEQQVRLTIASFSLTANNITYAAAGDMMRYWEFFPASDGMGVIPVWGFADVTASRCDELATGERIYGYFPMATHLTVTPGRITAGSFIDTSPHRQSLPVIYNQYLRCSHDPLYTRENEHLQMLLRPLFTTSFLLDDFMAENHFFDAEELLLTSASSKTALGMAYCLKQNRARRSNDYKIIGITSPGNREFVSGLGCYDQVICYNEIENISHQKKTVTVDFAGNGKVLQALHQRLAPNQQYSCLVGASHWDQRASDKKSWTGPAPVLFFAPTQAQKRIGEWGAAQFQRNVAESWAPFIEFVNGWMNVEMFYGPSAVVDIYHKLLSGQFPPSSGYILSLQDSAGGSPAFLY
ncbi:MAG: hypothetical protein CSA49_02420 [Gammaproteobacteria bacterium]|nr:MAG: hypothetical protein CSA49_02420 [Gammaproteobacteria bacterium]